MNKVRKLHNEAMILAESALVAKLKGEGKQASKLLREAYDRESKAAKTIAQQVSHEPTRSILFRSAASLAVECKEFVEAERLIATALSGNPPADIAEELRDLLEQVKIKLTQNRRILWLEEDIDRFTELVAGLQQQGFVVQCVRDVANAFSLLDSRMLYHLFLVDLLVPKGLVDQGIGPYEYGGLNFIHNLRNRYNIWDPVIMFTVVSESSVQEAAEKLRVFRLLHRGTIRPSELAQCVNNALISGRYVSIDEAFIDDALEDDNPTMLACISLEATIEKLSSDDREKILLGIQSARFLGGQEIVRKLSDVITHAVLTRNKLFFDKAVEALNYIREKGWFEVPSFLVESKPEIKRRRPDKMRPDISIFTQSQTLTSKEPFVNIEPNIHIGAVYGGVQIGVSSGDVRQAQIGTLSFNEIINKIEEVAKKRQDLDAEERRLLLEDIKTFENGVNTGKLWKVKAVTLLQKTKRRAPWIGEYFLSITEEAIGGALSAGIVEAIKFVFG